MWRISNDIISHVYIVVINLHSIAVRRDILRPLLMLCAVWVSCCMFIVIGRFREFYQCDFDIAGTYATMVPDAEVVAVCCEILESLDLGNFKVKLNHRKLLDALMASCGRTDNCYHIIATLY